MLKARVECWSSFDKVKNSVGNETIHGKEE